MSDVGNKRYCSRCRVERGLGLKDVGRRGAWVLLLDDGTIINLLRAAAANQSINPITMADSEDRAPSDIKAEAPQATTTDPTAPPTGDDIDVEVEMQDDNTNNTKGAANMNMDGANDDPPTVPQIETRMPAKKDVALRDFLGKMDEYAPIVSSPSTRVATRYSTTTLTNITRR